MEIDGSPGTGASSGQARSPRSSKHVVANLPKGMGYEWSGIARQQVQSGPQTIAVFAMGLLFVFLVLVAQYESLSTPFVIMLAVPLALLGAIGAIYHPTLGRARQPNHPLEDGRSSGAHSDYVVRHLRADRLRHAHRPGRQERDL